MIMIPDGASVRDLLRIKPILGEKLDLQGGEKDEAGGKETHHLGSGGSEATGHSIRTFGKQEGKLRK
jgi:hypothetical protein